MVTALRGRALIAQGLFEEAVVQSDVDMSSVTRSMRGELMGVKALALAASGHLQRAGELAASSLEASLGVETSINARCALAVTALTNRQHDAALEHAAVALERAVGTGMIESLVCAYRGCPQLIVCLLERRELHDPLMLVLRRADDAQLAASAGIRLGTTQSCPCLPARRKCWRLSPKDSPMPLLERLCSSVRSPSRFTCATSSKSLEFGLERKPLFEPPNSIVTRPRQRRFAARPDDHGQSHRN